MSNMLLSDSVRGALGTVYVTQLKSRYLRIQRKEKARHPLFPISFVFFRLGVVATVPLLSSNTFRLRWKPAWSGSYFPSSLCALHICMFERRKTREKDSAPCRREFHIFGTVATTTWKLVESTTEELSRTKRQWSWNFCVFSLKKFVTIRVLYFSFLSM